MTTWTPCCTLEESRDDSCVLEMDADWNLVRVVKKCSIHADIDDSHLIEEIMVICAQRTEAENDV